MAGYFSYRAVVDHLRHHTPPSPTDEPASLTFLFAFKSLMLGFIALDRAERRLPLLLFSNSPAHLLTGAHPDDDIITSSTIWIKLFIDIHWSWFLCFRSCQHSGDIKLQNNKSRSQRQIPPPEPIILNWIYVQMNTRVKVVFISCR